MGLVIHALFSFQTRTLAPSPPYPRPDSPPPHTCCAEARPYSCRRSSTNSNFRTLFPFLHVQSARVNFQIITAKKTSSTVGNPANKPYICTRVVYLVLGISAGMALWLA